MVPVVPAEQGDGIPVMDGIPVPDAVKVTDVVEVPDVIEVAVGVGSRVMVVSDLLLGSQATPVSTSISIELSQAITRCDGPAVLILAGNLFELLATDRPDPLAALTAHPELTAAVVAFGRGVGRQVLCLPGSRDGRVAWDGSAGRTVVERLGAKLALAVELRVETGAGTREVRVEPGHRFDPRNAVVDPRSPAESPLGHHVAKEILPSLGPAGTWLAGAERLSDPSAFPRFFASRLVYRHLAHYAGWLLIPFVLAIVLELPLTYLIPGVGHHRAGLAPWPLRLVVVGATTTVYLALVLVGALLVSRRTSAAISGAALGPSGGPNDSARAEARALVTSGHAGLITGHTRQPELAMLGPGFYANTGAAGEVVDELPARMGLPPVFRHRRLLSWLEIEAGADLHVRLLHAHQDLAHQDPVSAKPGRRPVERLMARVGPVHDSRPVVVASFPQGCSWPPVADTSRHQRKARRAAAVLIAAVGLIDLVSAVTPPLRGRLGLVLDLVPLSVSKAATALVALAGLGLLALAQAVRRGQRQAWAVSLSLLVGTSVGNLVKGGDWEETAVALLAASYLVATRSSFAAAVDRPSLRRGALTVVTGAIATIVATVAALEVSLSVTDHRLLAPVTAAEAVAQRMVGVRTVALPHRVGDFLNPALLGVGVGLAILLLALAFRPVVNAGLAALAPTAALATIRAREVVRRNGQGTLDYFALRADKTHFFWHASLVAYGVYGSVCLVSPDPIGPEAERDGVWASFRKFADAQGWTVAVLGAAEAWLPVYRSTGMHDLYLGDEGVVDVTSFSLAGGHHKGLRQAVNRIAKYGYTISFHDPAHLDPELATRVRAVMTKSRRGDVERGFSMTLGRIFDPNDQGLLLAVASGPDGEPVAFCQFVPAPGINGYSLDLMRRDDGDHPNGLLDFVVVRTIEHLRQEGMQGLGLNFATMRAVLAGETGESLPQRAQRWVLRRMSGSMQIESLWRFNSKFDPTWQPRYGVYDAPEHALAVAMAIARAESFWELPVIGRFLMPDDAKKGSSDVTSPAPVKSAAPPR
ncbi:MAG: hypothetical protein DLM54_01095 [Acidimicrobiales bacterium]|nr:MAG: hypothetical protein DLM54_01095 [Acidimicrobiales bacterium]